MTKCLGNRKILSILYGPKRTGSTTHNIKVYKMFRRRQRRRLRESEGSEVGQFPLFELFDII